MNIKIQVTKTLSEEDIMDIFVSAIETSDIHFWCCRLEIEDGWELLLKKEELESEDLVKNEKWGLAFARGAKATLFVDEGEKEPKECILVVRHLQFGIQKYFDNNSEATFDMGDWDGYVVDQMFQYALFGELVYC